MQPYPPDGLENPAGRLDMAVLLGTDPISVAMACNHKYEGVDNTERVKCSRCGLETTIAALMRIRGGT